MAAPSNEVQPNKREQVEQEQSPENRAEQPERLSGQEVIKRMYEQAPVAMERVQGEMQPYAEAAQHFGEPLQPETLRLVNEQLESTRPTVERFERIFKLLMQESGTPMEAQPATRVEAMPQAEQAEAPNVEQTIPVTVEQAPVQPDQRSDLDVAIPQPQVMDASAQFAQQDDATDNQVPVNDVVPPQQVQDKDNDEDHPEHPHQQSGPGITLAA